MRQIMAGIKGPAESNTDFVWRLVTGVMYPPLRFVVFSPARASVVTVLLPLAAACGGSGQVERRNPVAPTAVTNLARDQSLGLQDRPGSQSDIRIVEGGSIGPMAVLFPSRRDALSFREDLESNIKCTSDVSLRQLMWIWKARLSGSKSICAIGSTSARTPNLSRE